uniref:Macaca fascicularis brain cDNA clone: QmoA-10404, similar to human T-LAK cell-originated protein kinase (TOPK), mRNA, RefSeq: NM_018492.2 n=1 Tax=Macaca fascicularis TaxID=9541 RepID=I7G7Z7_MACFA|nr:unnamed protein product [Macaca fascicularis]
MQIIRKKEICIKFNSNYKYPCLSIYAEAWLWYWCKCLPYEKISKRFVSFSLGCKKD